MLNFTRRDLEIRAKKHSYRGQHDKAIAVYDHLIEHSGSLERYTYKTAIGDEYVKMGFYFEAFSYYDNAEIGFASCGNFTEAGQVGLKIEALKKIVGC